MATLLKIFVKNFNPDRLREEMPAGTAGVLTGLGWAGFDRSSSRLYVPKSERSIIGRSFSNGATVVDFADPGELRFSTSRDLTVLEDAALDVVLTAHVATNLSAEQVREDQDETDFQQMRTRLDGWATLTAAQKDEVLRRLVRLVLRMARGEEV
jgi:hypothetical protein